MKYISDLIEFLEKLEAKKIYYKLAKVRKNAIMVEAAIPGERWEIEFVLYDGQECAVEIERFKSDGTIQNEKELNILFDSFFD